MSMDPGIPVRQDAGIVLVIVLVITLLIAVVIAIMIASRGSSNSPVGPVHRRSGPRVYRGFGG